MKSLSERSNFTLFNSALMLVFVEVAVTVYQFLVTVGVFVDKVGAEQKIRVGKELFRLAISHQAMISPQNEQAVSHLLHHIQVLSAENQCLPLIRPAH
jgi:hypothetical protein